MENSNLKITNRNLPHWSLQGATYFITFRTKNTVLSKIEIKIVLQKIQDGNKQFYDLYTAVVMPDHIHIILRPFKKYDISTILKGIKGVSAREINRIKDTNGSVWQTESFDRIIRDEEEFIEKMNYIFNNPVKAGLSEDPLDYPGLYVCSK